jgi:hypothetical protein
LQVQRSRFFVFNLERETQIEGRGKREEREKDEDRE